MDPKMPKSRRVTAIPFIGKDVPSQRSEFKFHPDIVIGLTILAYRYEGAPPRRLQAPHDHPAAEHVGRGRALPQAPLVQSSSPSGWCWQGAECAAAAWRPTTSRTRRRRRSARRSSDTEGARWRSMFGPEVTNGLPALDAEGRRPMESPFRPTATCSPSSPRPCPRLPCPAEELLSDEVMKRRRCSTCSMALATRPTEWRLGQAKDEANDDEPRTPRPTVSTPSSAPLATRDAATRDFKRLMSLLQMGSPPTEPAPAAASADVKLPETPNLTDVAEASPQAPAPASPPRCGP